MGIRSLGVSIVVVAVLIVRRLRIRIRSVLAMSVEAGVNRYEY
jgi:hypothetical protein